MLDWLTRAPDWLIAVCAAIVMFIAAQIEPSPGVWLASSSGAAFAIMFGRERKFTAGLGHATFCVFVGVFASQILAEIVTLKTPLARSAAAFFLSLFAEKLLMTINNGKLFEFLLSWRGRR